jgi:chromosome partitioning protein
MSAAAVKVIGVIQAKGGVGRSTIATNLAAIFSLKSPTLLIDCDLPQGTSASWFALRQQDLASTSLNLAVAATPRELVTIVANAGSAYRHVIIDGPPRLAGMTRAILLLSDLSLIPLGASAVEFWSASDLLPVIAEARKYRADLAVHIVWNRFRPQTREAQELRAAIAKRSPVVSRPTNG